MRAPRHTVKIVAGPSLIVGWQQYEITHDMLQPTSPFSLSIGPATIPLFVTLREDTRVRLYIDDVQQLDGFIDHREGTSEKGSGSVISIRGRDRASRLFDEAAPLVGFSGLGIKQLGELVCFPWVERIDLSNTGNRRLLTGGVSAKAGRVSKEPPIDLAPKAPRKVKPGETRWGVYSHFLQEGRLLGWLSADGKALIVGRPNYDQEPTYRFIEAPTGSPNARFSNVERLTLGHGVAEQYSQITCMSDVEEGEGVAYVKGVAKDGPEKDGTGNRFQHPKALIIMDQDVRSNAMAKARAEREMIERNAASHTLEIVVKGHSQQLVGAAKPTLFAFDTMARVDSESWDIHADYLITRVSFSHSKPSGPVTSLSLVPKGTELTS